MTEKIGLYIHVPFCAQKCPYCDFYSLTDISHIDQYTDAVIRLLRTCGEANQLEADTLYFGGGTPNLLGADRICKIIRTAKEQFRLEDAEITVEVNPTSDLGAFFEVVAKSGVNRVSIGLQSAHEDELKLLGRTHTPHQVELAIKAARDAGINNISCDLMLGLPHQTKERLKDSIAFCANFMVTHISAYLLKIEPETVFGRHESLLSLPDEDQVSDLYLYAVEELERQKYHQYEISNFARKDINGKLKYSHHNLKYWNCDPYLGLGPSAHSFLGGKRFHYDRDLSQFFIRPVPVFDSVGGDREEYVMLRLRLCEGLCAIDWQEKFQEPFPNVFLERAKEYENAGLTKVIKGTICLTPRGFLVSNRLIATILYG